MKKKQQKVVEKEYESDDSESEHDDDPLHNDPLPSREELYELTLARQYENIKDEIYEAANNGVFSFVFYRRCIHPLNMEKILGECKLTVKDVPNDDTLVEVCWDKLTQQK
jgi:hypothetical protein